MPSYEYECRKHGRTEIHKPMDEASLPEYCLKCRFGPELHDVPIAPMKRIYNPQRTIIRPSGWNLHPEDPRYSDFSRELELGEVRDPGDKAESGGATVTPARPRVDHSSASIEAERNLRQAVEAALGE